jgi:uncharacterized protein YjiS (DUF1127 family)
MTDIIAYPTNFDSPKSHSGWLAALARWLDRAMNAECTRQTLEELPDNVLRDIGMTRSEIPFIANVLASGNRLSHAKSMETLRP